MFIFWIVMLGAFHAPASQEKEDVSLSKALRRWAAVIAKEVKHIWFDPSFLFLTIFSPAVLLMLLAYVFSFNVQGAKLVLIDQDQTPQSYQYVRSLSADGDIEIVANAHNYNEAISLFKRGRADTALIIPPGFGAALLAGKPAEVNLVVDASDPSIANQVIASFEQRSAAFTAEMFGAPRAGFDVRARVWFNPNLESQYSMIPGLIPIVLILPALAVALGVTREKEMGTFETLVTTPVQGPEFLIGKLLVYLLLGLVGMLLALAVAVFWFQVPFIGSLPLYLVGTAVYLFAVMSFCLLVAQFISSQRTATSIVLLALFIPSFFLTGLIIPVDKSSRFTQAASLALPSTHFITISRGIALKGVSFDHLWFEILALLVMGLLGTSASVIAFRKKIG